jgi:pilus assembly protein CpaF
MGVVERLARRVVSDPVALDRAAVAAHVTRLLPTEAPLLDATEALAVVDAVLGLGPLERLLRDPAVSDLLVNGDGAVWVERSGRLQREDADFGDPGELVAAIERIIAPLGLRLDPASPAVDARLPDGSRLHAIVPPASPDGPVLAIRRFSETVRNLDELVAAGGVSRSGADRLRTLIEDRANILVCGPTGAGKTTLLNVLLHELPAGERVVTIEDAAELRPVGHAVRLEGRPGNSEGAGAITPRQLLRHALRLRPDRLIVGEVRGAEAFDMIQALSTGHDGSMSTIHARSATEALWRLETLALLEVTATAESVHRQVERAVDAVVVVGRRGAMRLVLAIHVGEVEVYSCS